ncbi:nuclear transport factor 2 family protein [Actinoplanes sp. KI2]|uniref:nuclear transport factor 2 family protein n=1 Tax=Actinoplanes sp. KI2 TaxID=2983315 RepID=UPI0021D59DF2|nr:nuclear transport factor 2 family protein [Actinoplanes sp. KI2]MCU7726171.1 nuclear transport factor 2 family protein [Actinoplanes sp. KI2]
MSTPREVFERLSDGIGSGDWSELHLLYAENAEVTIPFMMPAAVRIHGREQVRQHFAQLDGQITLEPRDVRVYETSDPELIVAEFDYAVGGRVLPNIQVLRVRDGLIVETRDYHHHAALAEMMG